MGGTQAWYAANGGRYKRTSRRRGRNDWIDECPGAVKGQPGQCHPPVFGYQPSTGSLWVSTGSRWMPPQGSLASLTAIPSRCLGTEVEGASQAEPSRSQSMPNL